LANDVVERHQPERRHRQERVNPEAAFLRVFDAEFYHQNPSTVLLTTSQQTGPAYRVTVVNATDLASTALAPGHDERVLVDPTSAFHEAFDQRYSTDVTGRG
jgi:hypothetical protein